MTSTPMSIVALCDRFDIAAVFGPAFEASDDLSLFRPEDVEDAGAIRYALAFEPSAEQLSTFSNLRGIVSAGAGVDGILAVPGLRPDIPVVRMVNPDQARMMAGYVIYHVVGWHRQLWLYADQQAKGTWAWLDMPTSPSDFPVGLLGFGHLGQEIARALKELGYPVTAWASRARRTEEAEVVSGPDGLHHLLTTCRAVVNVLPLTEATRGLLNAERLGWMRPDAFLVQIGRGEHVMTEDLCTALSAGALGGAVLDVVEGEPLAEDSPLWRQPGLRITPHMASFNTPSFVADATARAVAAMEAGETPIGLVDRNRGY